MLKFIPEIITSIFTSKKESEFPVSLGCEFYEFFCPIMYLFISTYNCYYSFLYI